MAVLIILAITISVGVVSAEDDEWSFNWSSSDSSSTDGG